MSEIIPVPSLSANGWVTAITEKSDRLYAQFFVAEQSQSGSYEPSAVSSLPWIIQEYGHDPLDCTIQLKQRLELYLGRYYDTVNVFCTIDNDEVQEASGRYNIKLVTTLTQAGKEYSLGSLIETANSKVVNIMSINNGA